jgi:DnaJ-domain-containing protein 1
MATDIYWARFGKTHGQAGEDFSQSAQDDHLRSTANSSSAHRFSSDDQQASSAQRGTRNEHSSPGATPKNHSYWGARAEEKSRGGSGSHNERQSSGSQGKAEDRARAHRECPTEETDPYRIFGIPKSADHSTVRKAWRKALQRVHPDRSKDVDATYQTQRINRAYDSIRREKGWGKTVTSN